MLSINIYLFKSLSDNVSMILLLHNRSLITIPYAKANTIIPVKILKHVKYKAALSMDGMFYMDGLIS